MPYANFKKIKRNARRREAKEVVEVLLKSGQVVPLSRRAYDKMMKVAYDKAGVPRPPMEEGGEGVERWGMRREAQMELGEKILRGESLRSDEAYTIAATESNSARGKTLTTMISGSLKVGNKVLLSIAPQKADGSPATVDGKPVWSNAGAGTLEVSEDGLSAWLRQLGLKEVADVTVTADADLDEDETRNLSENFVVLGRSNEVNEASAIGGSIGTEVEDTETPAGDGQ